MLLLPAMLEPNSELKIVNQGRVPVGNGRYSRQETLHSGSNRGIDQWILLVVLRHKRHDGILTFECGDQGVLGAVVDFDRLDSRWKAISLAALGDGGDLESCVDEFLYDGRSKVAGSSSDCDFGVRHRFEVWVEW